ncbi:MAG: hypothetical protein HYZ21_00275 [Chloroflexi bacterium]|nr:hypothetical protein [Chloroflexota bacterium]
MQPKRMKISLVILICLLGLAACGNLGDGTETQEIVLPFTQPAPVIPNTGGLCDNSLYPVRQGASWAYINSGGPNGSFAYSDTISAVRENGFTLTSQFTNVTRTQEWACETGGLKALNLGGGITASITAQGMAAEFITTATSGISLPSQITSGMQWQYGLTLQGTIPIPTGEQVPSNGSYSATMQEMGAETITVPAGTFEAVKIQASSIVDILVPFGDMQVPMKYSGTNLYWYAPGIGYIKSVENWDFSGTPYTSTTELQSYVIP